MDSKVGIKRLSLFVTRQISILFLMDFEEMLSFFRAAKKFDQLNEDEKGLFKPTFLRKKMKFAWALFLVKENNPIVLALGIPCLGVSLYNIIKVVL